MRGEWGVGMWEEKSNKILMSALVEKGGEEKEETSKMKGGVPLKRKTAGFRKEEEQGCRRC